ncbi:MAG: chorismate-binding protein [Cryomorphaceae bacterium]
MADNLPDNSIIYSLPGSQTFTLARTRKATSTYQDGTSAIVIRPFSDREPPLFHVIDSEETFDVSKLELGLPNCDDLVSAKDKEAYIDLIRDAIEHCNATQGKVVLSRKAQIPLKSIQIGNSLSSLRAKFPQAFVYLLNHKTLGVWMGASPEVLIEKSDGLHSTMALAGTKWGDALFGQKEFEEQMSVARYIIGMLEDTVVEVSDVYEQPFGALRHLRTDFRWEDERHVLEFAERLHPTPAVCGYPVSSSRDFIEHHEAYDRRIYSGYVGKIDGNENAHLFVNLRCMELFRDRVVVYIGGGINAMSDPALEWEETEKKKESVLTALHYE